MPRAIPLLAIPVLLAACASAPQSERAADAPGASPPDPIGAMQGKRDGEIPEEPPARGPYAEPAMAVLELPPGRDLVVENGRWRLERGAPATASEPPEPLTSGQETWLAAAGDRHASGGPRTIHPLRQDLGIHVFLLAPAALVPGRPDRLSFVILNFRARPAEISLDLEVDPPIVAASLSPAPIRVEAGGSIVVAVSVEASSAGRSRILVRVHPKDEPPPGWQTAVISVAGPS